MRVSLSIYGGLLPRFGGTPHVVDIDELAEHDKEELLRLVSAAIATTSAVSPPAGADVLRDARTYQIAIENSCTTRVLEATDGSVPEAFAALRNWLCDH
jgi:emfourin